MDTTDTDYQCAPQPSYYAIVPANVRYCKNLEPNAKLLYGEITALCSSKGYCWASNQHFADLYDVDVRTIKRWIASLASHDFVFIHTIKKGFHNIRKIYLSEEIKKMFTEGQKCPPEGTKMSPTRGQKCHPINTGNTKKEKQQQPAAPAAAVPSKRSDNNKKPAAVHREKRSNPMTPLVHDCLADVDMSDREKETLSSEHSYDVVKQAVAALNSPGLKIKTTTTRFMNWACLEGIGPDPKKEDVVEKNRALVARLDGKINKSKTVKIEVLNKSVEFVFLGSPKIPDVFTYDSASFGQHVSKAIDQYGFDIKMVK